MIVLAVIGFMFVFFGLVVVIGAPYLPTQKRQIEQAVELMGDLKGKKVAELGAGTGGVAVAMAKEGASVTAYEINPLLAIVIFARAKLGRHDIDVKIKTFLKADLADIDGVYVFQLDKFMNKLAKKFSSELKKDSFVVTYAFKVPGKKPGEVSGPMYRYDY